ncbi:MAG: zinc ribbon domain-containing protein [Coriobacteriia bacterium]|nr:zinc ribbon domain-containing protein [Coriobacteriia bacterium]
MRMETSVTGGGSNPGKIMFYLGLLFVVIGAMVGLGGVVGAFAMGDPGATLFGLFFVVMFCGIGGFFAKMGYDSMHASDDVLAEGAAYLGKIFDYAPDYQILMNGQPCITLVVRYFMNGQIREARVNTGEVTAARYPRGATVAIRVLNDMAAIVPGSVSSTTIERENDLMNPDFDPSGMASSVGVSCPNCGANIVVPLGMSRFCPYCDTKVSVSSDGRLLA